VNPNTRRDQAVFHGGTATADEQPARMEGARKYQRTTVESVHGAARVRHLGRKESDEDAGLITSR
jgi:short subunit dehydrogenase-like uncharacterized protein